MSKTITTREVAIFFLAAALGMVFAAGLSPPHVESFAEQCDRIGGVFKVGTTSYCVAK